MISFQIFNKANNKLFAFFYPLLFKFSCSIILFAQPTLAEELSEKINFSEKQLAIAHTGFYDMLKHWYDKNGYDLQGNKIIADGKPGIKLHPINNTTAIADNILIYQRSDGGWPTNKNLIAVMTAQEIQQQQALYSKRDSSFDNRNTYPQIEYLAYAYQQTLDERYKTSVLKGIDFILKQQFKNGGFPHTASTDKPYYQHITFADDVMSGVLSFLRTVNNNLGQHDIFNFIDSARQLDIQKAINKGDELIIALQIKQHNQATIWAGQYHKTTLQPDFGRAYEHPALITWESVSVVRYLMSIPEPSVAIQQAIHHAIQWYKKHGIKNLTLKKLPHAPIQFQYNTSSYDLRSEYDTNAKIIWARFYDLQTNQPFMARRDGEKVYQLAEIDRERRTGYDWYGYWPETLLNEDYPNWLNKYKLTIPDNL